MSNIVWFLEFQKWKFLQLSKKKNIIISKFYSLGRVKKLGIVPLYFEWITGLQSYDLTLILKNMVLFTKLATLSGLSEPTSLNKLNIFRGDFEMFAIFKSQLKKRFKTHKFNIGTISNSTFHNNDLLQSEVAYFVKLISKFLSFWFMMLTVHHGW